MKELETKRECYDSISTATRRLLVQLVTEENMSIHKAAQILKIKYSTSKTLVQHYKKTGSIDRIKQQRKYDEKDKNIHRDNLIKAYSSAKDQWNKLNDICDDQSISSMEFHESQEDFRKTLHHQIEDVPETSNLEQKISESLKRN